MILAKRSLASENLAKPAQGCKKFHVEQYLAVEMGLSRSGVPRETFAIAGGWNHADRAVPRGTLSFQVTTPPPSDTTSLCRKLVCGFPDFGGSSGGKLNQDSES